MKRSPARALAVVAALLSGSGAVARADAPLSPRQQLQYQVVCATCHAMPGTGAPLTGDRAAWLERNAQGFEALLRNTVDGMRSMPPLGTCGSCTEADLRALVAYLSGLPAEPAE